MKILKILILFNLLALFGCSDNSNNTYITNENLLNDWTLVRSTGTIAGITNEFPYGTIVWKFYDTNTVIVINNNTDESLQSGLPSGT